MNSNLTGDTRRPPPEGKELPRPSRTLTTGAGPPRRKGAALSPADDWIDVRWVEARMTLRDAKGKLHNYVAAAVLPAGRAHEARVRRDAVGNVEADPDLRACPPATLVMRDEVIGACYLFART